MPLLKAHRVSFFLASGGFNSVKKLNEISLQELVRMRDEPGSRTPEMLRQSGYIAKDTAEGHVVVTFHGSPLREGETVHRYDEVLRNCGYGTELEADPDREGRLLLKVVSG